MNQNTRVISVICCLLSVLSLCWCNLQTVSYQASGRPTVSSCSLGTQVEVEFRGFRYRQAQISALLCCSLGETYSPPATSSNSSSITFANLCLILDMCCFRRFCWQSEQHCSLQNCSISALISALFPYFTHLLHNKASSCLLPLLLFLPYIHSLAWASTFHKLWWCNFAVSYCAHKTRLIYSFISMWKSQPAFYSATIKMQIEEDWQGLNIIHKSFWQLQWWII